MADSGNCYKVRLCAAQLGIALERHPTNILTGGSRTPEFLARNPNGKVPLLVLPDGEPLAESNAMLLHLAEGSALLPAPGLDRSLVHQWLFFEQYSHERFIATNRFWRHILKDTETYAEQIAANEPNGYAALDVMEQQLRQTDFLVACGYSIADIALYAYTHVADQGGFDLEPYPAIRRWLQRIAAQPNHIRLLD